MNLSQIVCSLDNAKKLDELNVKSNCFFLWSPNPFKETGHYIATQAEAAITAIRTNVTRDESYPAFTASELMEILPWSIDTKEKARSGYGLTAKPRIEKSLNGYRGEYVSTNATYANVHADTLVDALALLLIHLIENSYYEPRMDTTMVETDATLGRMGKA